MSNENSTNARTTEKCFSWITRSNGKLDVSTPKALQNPMPPSDKFLNFTTVIGPARQGKSFLMNYLIGDSVFRSTDSMGVCTKGVQVANVKHRTENGGCAFFVDTEGQGDEDIESDATLLTPILLLSKVILFNWKGGLQKSEILNKLALLVEVANCVSSSSLEAHRPKFGHLHIVLRDFHYEGTVEEAFAVIFDEEDKRGEQFRQRNKVREKLRSSFESISVFILPIPSEDVSNLDLHTTSEEFQTRVKDLKKIILGQLKEPRSFGKVVVNFENVDALVTTFAKNLEKGDIVNIKSVVMQLQRATIDKAKQRFKENLIKAYKDIDIRTDEGLEQQLIQRGKALLDEFSGSTAQVDLENEYRDNVLEELKTWASRKLKEKVEAKRKEESLHQQSCVSKAVADFRSGVEDELQRQREEKNISSLRRNFQQRKKKLIEKFRNSTRRLHLVTQFAEEELRKLENWAASKFEEKVEAVEREERQQRREAEQTHTYTDIAKALIPALPALVKGIEYLSGASSGSSSQQSASGSRSTIPVRFRNSTSTQEPLRLSHHPGIRFQGQAIHPRSTTSSARTPASSSTRLASSGSGQFPHGGGRPSRGDYRR